MLPLIAALTLPTSGAPVSPSGLTLAFPGGATTGSIENPNRIQVIATYSGPGDPTSGISFQVNKVGSGPTQWYNPEFAGAPLESVSHSDYYSHESAGYDGPGEYELFAVARRTSTGAYDTVSNRIYLSIG